MEILSQCQMMNDPKLFLNDYVLDAAEVYTQRLRNNFVKKEFRSLLYRLLSSSKASIISCSDL
jgi:hypothetical protein